MLYIGMAPRVMVKSRSSGLRPRFTETFTLEPLAPRRCLRTQSLVILSPTASVSSTFTILSPASSPTFSEGPLMMTSMTLMVSLIS